MSAPSRPTTCWSAATKSTGFTNQTTPLVTTRRKLFRPVKYHQKHSTQRTNQSKHDIEELFKLYYSNDIRFDHFQRQIVTGTRMLKAPISQNKTLHTSTNMFDSKHCVTREQLSTSDVNCNEPKLITSEMNTRHVEPCRIDKNSSVDLPVPSLEPSIPVPLKIPTVSNLPETSSAQKHELCDPTIVKSVTFLEDTSTQKQRPISSKSSSSSIIRSSLTPSPMMMNNSRRKDPSISTMTSSKQQQHSSVVAHSTDTVRQRSLMKQPWRGLRPTSNTTMTTNLSAQQSISKSRPSSTCSPVPIESDIPDLPVHTARQRVVSIPSKCSRFVLVTFPEASLRYHAPSYVERLLLFERFPTLFHNIVHNYDQHVTTAQHHRQAK